MLRFFYFLAVAVMTGLLAINVADAPNGVAMAIAGLVYLWSITGVTVLYLWAR